jgi:hypothetical protein
MPRAAGDDAVAVAAEIGSQHPRHLDAGQRGCAPTMAIVGKRKTAPSP